MQEIITSRRAFIRSAIAFGALGLVCAPVTARADVESAKEDYFQASEQLDKIASECDQIAAEMGKTKAAIEDTQGALADIQPQMDETSKRLDGLKEQMGAIVADEYKSGGSVSAIDLLLSSRDFDEMLNNTHILNRRSRQQSDVIADVKGSMEKLSAQKTKLDSYKEELVQLSMQQDTQYQELASRQSEARDLVRAASEAVRDAALAGAARDGGTVRCKVFDLPESHGGPEYDAASDAERAIADSAHRVGSPGAGLCAAWVHSVYANAGHGGIHGNACDVYYNWCGSSDRSKLEVGMAVAVASHPHTRAGSIYGHVGIYIGDSYIMDNVGKIRTTNIDDWCDYYGATMTPMWGWDGGISL